VIVILKLILLQVSLMGQKIGQPCSTEDARTLYAKYAYNNHFLETDFTTPERKLLNRGATKCVQGFLLVERKGPV
jgi:hypothetical protein